MRHLALNLAAIISVLGVIVSFVMGIINLAQGKIIHGLLTLSIGIPVCLALAVDYDYVSDRMRRDVIEGKVRGTQDVIDTPWEDDPDYNPGKDIVCKPGRVSPYT